ncbi:hypothetical protein PanNE5_39400 [Pandoraea sp. NE5]|nr:hypothetical protein PanNE5_39400 [Pandoraea sp. NE5]
MLRRATASGTAVQKHRRLATRISAPLPIHLVPIAHIEHAALERLDRRVQATQRLRANLYDLARPPRYKRLRARTVWQAAGGIIGKVERHRHPHLNTGLGSVNVTPQRNADHGNSGE